MSIHSNSKKQISSDRRHSTSALHINNKRRFSSYYDDKDRVQGSIADVYHLKLYVKLLQKEKMKALAEAAKLEAQISDVEVKIAQNELKYFKLDLRTDGEKDKYGRASKKLRIEEDCKSKPQEVPKHKSSEKENSDRKHKIPRKDTKNSKSRSIERRYTDIKSSKCVQHKDAALSQKKSSHHKSKNKTSHSELPVTEEKVPQQTELPQKPVLNEVAQSNGALPTKEDAALSQKKSSHHKSKNKTSHGELPVTEQKVPHQTELPQKPVINEVAQKAKEDMTVHPESLENNKINNILFKEIMANKRYNGGNDDTCSINSACTLILKTGNCLFNDDLVQISK